jgi:hypothetical protein
MVVAATGIGMEYYIDFTRIPGYSAGPANFVSETFSRRTQS